MKDCTIFGYLYGAVCDDLRVWDRIEGAQLFAVPSKNNLATADSLARPNHAADAKISVIDIDQARFDREANTPLRGRTNNEGAFCLEGDFDGGLIDLYVCIDRIPAPTLEKGSVRLDKPCYLFLGTYKPFQVGDLWYLIVVIPSAVWCRIPRKADLWVIVGRVTPCDDGSVGLKGLKVTAKDVDLVQHDILGSGVTNPSGVFRIDYPGSSFRKGTWIDVELIGGPDVYFEIEDAGGATVLDEPPSRGRRKDRCDRGPCFCLELCLDVPVPTQPKTPTAWTKVGTAFTIPDSSSLNDFDADGYAGSLKYAIHGSPRLLGSAPSQTNLGNPIEYRFVVSDVTTPNGGPPPAAGNFTRIVGAGTDVGLFASTEIGEMVRNSPFTIVKVNAIQADLDSDGWLDINTSIARTFAAHPTLAPADIPDFGWADGDALMALNTTGLTTEPNVPGNVGVAGDAVPAANRIAIESNAVRFEAREVVDKANSVFNPLALSGTTLNSMVVNNNSAYFKVAMAEHLAGTFCDPLSGPPPHVAYAAYHPHVAAVGINVRSNDGAYNHNLNDTASKPATSDAAIPVAGNTNSPGVNHFHNPSIDLPPGLHKCTYIVTLSVTRRLHNGESAVLANTPQTSFYYEP